MDTMYDHKKRTAEMIAVMQAYVDGKAIEFSCDGSPFAIVAGGPIWSWDCIKYRIATIPDSINWGHVAPEWKWMARDNFDAVWLFKQEPSACDRGMWETRGGSVICTQFASYTRGTVDWQQSLVRRPE